MSKNNRVFSLTYLTPGEEREYDDFKEKGFLDNYMLTLGTPPNYRKQTLEKMVDNWLKNVEECRAKSGCQSSGLILANKGRFGQDYTSAHVIFKDRAPSNLSLLMKNWQNNYGTFRPKTIAEARKNKNGLRYWVKNYNENTSLYVMDGWK